jgi:hypothetical protein
MKQGILLGVGIGHWMHEIDLQARLLAWLIDCPAASRFVGRARQKISAQKFFPKLGAPKYLCN